MSAAAQSPTPWGTLQATEFGWPDRGHPVDWGASERAMQALFGDLAQGGAVTFLMLVGDSGLWQRFLRRGPHWPSVIPGQLASELGAHGLKQLANPGFSLVLGLADDPSISRSQLVRRGFEQAGSSRLGSGEKYDPLFVALNKGALTRGFSVSRLLPAKGLITFGHDCEPIYVIEPGASL